MVCRVQSRFGSSSDRYPFLFGSISNCSVRFPIVLIDSVWSVRFPIVLIDFRLVGSIFICSDRFPIVLIDFSWIGSISNCSDRFPSFRIDFSISISSVRFPSVRTDFHFLFGSISIVWFDFLVRIDFHFLFGPIFIHHRPFGVQAPHRPIDHAWADKQYDTPHSDADQSPPKINHIHSIPPPKTIVGIPFDNHANIT